MPAAAHTAEIARRYLSTLEARAWDAWTALLAPDVVYELPQNRERVRGREAFLTFNITYPGDWHLAEKVVIADEDRAVIWVAWRVGDDSGDAQFFLDVDDDGLVTHVTDFWPEPVEPPLRPEAVVVERY